MGEHFGSPGGAGDGLDDDTDLTAEQYYKETYNQKQWHNKKKKHNSHC